MCPHLIEIQNESQGELFGKPDLVFQFNKWLAMGTIDYHLKIEAKDNQFKYTFTNFRHSSPSQIYGFVSSEEDCFEMEGIMTKKQKQNTCIKLKTQIEHEVTRLVNSMKDHFN